jgi:hypothetical protein
MKPLLIVVFIFSFAGCRQQEDPGQVIQRQMDLLVKAAELRDLDPFKTHFSEDVKDQTGRGKKELLGMLWMLFQRHREIHLYVLSMEKEEVGVDRFEVTIELLMGSSALPEDRGIFDVTWRKEGRDWRVWQLSWGEGYGRD